MDVPLETVRRLVADQFPQWAHLQLTPVPRQGNDNRTFRLGSELSVRLPSAAAYVPGIAKEDRWLPVIARQVSTAVPVPVATGRPGAGYPHPWSVRQWITGTTPDRDPDLDGARLAEDLGVFLRELRSVPPTGGPAAGAHSFYRGTHPSVYGDQVQAALAVLADRVDVQACRTLWKQAVRSAWPADPVWFHGDLAPGNVLTSDGRLSGMIDFGTCGVGDPACDLVIAWTLFSEAERGVLADAVRLDPDTWERARGWALWKALTTLCDPGSDLRPQHARALDALVAEHRGA